MLSNFFLIYLRGLEPELAYRYCHKIVILYNYQFVHKRIEFLHLCCTLHCCFLFFFFSPKIIVSLMVQFQQCGVHFVGLDKCPMTRIHHYTIIQIISIVLENYLHSSYLLGAFPGDANGKESACQCRRHKRCGFDSWVRKISWKREWLPTPVFLPKESHGQRSLVGYNPQGCKESDMTKATQHTQAIYCPISVTPGNH